MIKLTKRQAGKRGGLATVAKHGREHMRVIGKRGAATFWKRYGMHPLETSGWVIYRKATGEPVSFIGSHPALTKKAAMSESDSQRLTTLQRQPAKL